MEASNYLAKLSSKEIREKSTIQLMDDFANEKVKELEEDIRTMILTSDMETMLEMEEKYKHLK